jgi:hypothetical protein
VASRDKSVELIRELIFGLDKSIEFRPELIRELISARDEELISGRDESIGSISVGRIDA